jgi:localization factor PodJL
MKSGASWSTRSFRPETLEAAREAARRSGLSLSEWLHSAILDTAAAAGVRTGRREPGAYELAPDEDALGLIAERLDEISERIERMGRRGKESDAAGLGAAAEIDRSVRGLKDRLAAALRELVPQGRTSTARLADLIRELNSRLERMGPPPTLGEFALREAPVSAPQEHRVPCCENAAGLREALPENSARQRELDAESRAAQDVSRLEQQLRHITDRIETLRRPDEQLRRLAEHVETLRRSQPAAEAVAADPAALKRIESKMLDLREKFGAFDTRLVGLDAIERSIAALALQLNDTRAAAIEQAERAARVVAGEMLADSAAMGSDIESLKRELSEFRANRAAIDQRTEDALEAVHGTLERLVERLAAAEIGVRAPAGNFAAAEEAHFVPASRSSSAAAPAPPAAPAQRRFEPELLVDHPLEPGSGAPRGHTTPNAARGPADAAAPAGPRGGEPAAKASFIAAARRAAQAAAAESKKSADSATTPPEQVAGIVAAVANHRRPLMVAGGVLLFGAASLHLGLNGRPLPLSDFWHSVSVETFGSGAEEPAPRAAAAKTGTVPPDGESRAAGVPDPVVPESGATAFRRPASAADDFLLLPVPDGKLLPVTGSTPPAPRAAPSPPRTNEVTGSLSPAPVNAAAAAGARPAPERTPQGAAKLPNTIGSPALRAAAAAGNSAAEYEIGIRFSEGRVVAQSFEEAAHWLARAADHGLAPAQYRLGSLYEKGQGVKKDLIEARRLYLSAAQQGNAKAMHNLAVLYAVGFEGGPDYRAASEWFHKAAQYGVADSQYNLGILYARGVGVEQNLAESYKWFALAAPQGDKDAAHKRDDVAAQLDAKALTAAQQSVQTFTADAQPDKAVRVEPPGDGPLPIAPALKTKSERAASGSA